MENNGLPKEYRGFSTERLTELLKMRLDHTSLEGVPVEEISAMNHLSRDYKLSPIYKASL